MLMSAHNVMSSLSHFDSTPLVAVCGTRQRNEPRLDAVEASIRSFPCGSHCGDYFQHTRHARRQSGTYDPAPSSRLLKVARGSCLVQ